MMITRRVLCVAGTSSLLLAGCGGGLISPSQAPLQIYVLNPAVRRLDGPQISWQLAVGRPEVTESLQSERIALLRGNTLDYFANAEWSDPTARLLQTLLVEAFETSGRISGVAAESAGVRADYSLETEVRNFEAHYVDENGAPDVVVAIVAKLLDQKGNVLGTLESRHDARATQNTVSTVVTAFERATGDAVEEIAAWALELPSHATAAGSPAR
ncbi:MAG: ABC-type transport auxiliary lipoprotein family protein [Rhizomicrobium sp.]